MKLPVMVATTVTTIHAPRLRHGALSLPETIGQSIANIAPTLTPALNIIVVAGLAGVGSWVPYLIATLGCVFVGASISALAKRHAEAGWSMILACLATGIALVFGFPIFLRDFLAVFKLTLSTLELTGFTFAYVALATFAAYRDIQVSSRVGLVLETVSIGIIIPITAIVVGKHGTVIDPVQFNFAKLPLGGIMSAMAFAVFTSVAIIVIAFVALPSPHRSICTATACSRRITSSPA